MYVHVWEPERNMRLKGSQVADQGRGTGAAGLPGGWGMGSLRAGEGTEYVVDRYLHCLAVSLSMEDWQQLSSLLQTLS